MEQSDTSKKGKSWTFNKIFPFDGKTSLLNAVFEASFRPFIWNFGMVTKSYAFSLTTTPPSMTKVQHFNSPIVHFFSLICLFVKVLWLKRNKSAEDNFVWGDTKHNQAHNLFFHHSPPTRRFPYRRTRFGKFPHCSGWFEKMKPPVLTKNPTQTYA